MSGTGSTSWSGLIENELPSVAATQREESVKIRRLVEEGERSWGGDESFEENLFEKVKRSKRKTPPTGSRLKRPRRNLSSAESSDGSIRNSGSRIKERKLERSEAHVGEENPQFSEECSLLDRLCDDERMPGDSVVSMEGAERLTEAWRKEKDKAAPTREVIDRLTNEGLLDERCVVGFWERQKTREEGRRGSAKDCGKTAKSSRERTELLSGRVVNKDMVNRKFMKALAKERSPSVKRRALLSVFNDPTEAAKADVVASFVHRKGIELLRDWLRDLAGERDPDIPLVEACLSSLDQLEITEDILRHTGIGRVVTIVVKRFAIASESCSLAGRALLEKWKAIVTNSRKAADSVGDRPPSADTASPSRALSNPTSIPGRSTVAAGKSLSREVECKGRDEINKGGDDADLDCLMDLMVEEMTGGESGKSTPKAKDQGNLSLMALPGSEDFEDDGEEEKPESTLNVSASTESSPKIRWKEDSELVAMVVFEKNEPLWDTVAAIANARGKHVKYVEHLGHTSKFMEQRKKEAAMGGSHLGSEEKESRDDNGGGGGGDEVSETVKFVYENLPFIAIPLECMIDGKRLETKSYERQDLADLHGIRSEELYQDARVPHSPAEPPDMNTTVLLNGVGEDTLEIPLLRSTTTRPRSPSAGPTANSPPTPATTTGSSFVEGYNNSAMVYAPYYGSVGYSQNALQTDHLQMAYLQADDRYIP